MPGEAHLQNHFRGDEAIEWAAWGGLPIVSTFGQPQAEYAAIRKGAGLVDLPQRGILEFSGADRHSFLNNLLTNALVQPGSRRALTAGHGCYAFFLNLKGRIVGDVHVLEFAGERTLLECDREAADMLLRSFDLYLFGEKVRMRNASEDLHELAIHGPEALRILTDAADALPAFEATAEDFPATFDLPTAEFTVGGVPVLAWRDDVCGVPGVHLLAKRQEVVRLWEDLTTRFGQPKDGPSPGRRRLRPVGWAMFNACRVEAGTPLLGVDFAAAAPSRPGQKAEQLPDSRGGMLPAETGPLFAKAVSVSGGCYLGQEVVARMHARNVTARRIVGIQMQEDALPAAGAEVEVDEQPVGIVTSSTLSPVLSNACIALATLKRPHFEPGTNVRVAAEGRRARGQVVELPFLR